MNNVKVVLLKSFQPAGHLPFLVFEIRQPLETAMIFAESEFLTYEIGSEMVNEQTTANSFFRVTQ